MHVLHVWTNPWASNVNYVPGSKFGVSSLLRRDVHPFIMRDLQRTYGFAGMTIPKWSHPFPYAFAPCMEYSPTKLGHFGVKCSWKFQHHCHERGERHTAAAALVVWAAGGVPANDGEKWWKPQDDSFFVWNMSGKAFKFHGCTIRLSSYSLLFSTISWPFLSYAQSSDTWNARECDDEMKMITYDTYASFSWPFLG